MSQRNAFQLFQPIAGVRPTPLLSAAPPWPSARSATASGARDGMYFCLQLRVRGRGSARRVRPPSSRRVRRRVRADAYTHHRAEALHTCAFADTRDLVAVKTAMRAAARRPRRPTTLRTRAPRSSAAAGLPPPASTTASCWAASCRRRGGGGGAVRRSAASRRRCRRPSSAKRARRRGRKLRGIRSLRRSPRCRRPTAHPLRRPGSCALRRRIPRDSHELRLREALRSVAEGAPDEHAALSLVMEGAVACGAQSLQAELLERFRRLARRNRVELATLVHAAAPPPCARGARSARAGRRPVAARPPRRWCSRPPARAPQRRRRPRHGGCSSTTAAAACSAGFNHHVAHDGRRAIVHAEAHAASATPSGPTAARRLRRRPDSDRVDRRIARERRLRRGRPVPEVHRNAARRRRARRAAREHQGGSCSRSSAPLPHLLAEKSVAAPLGVTARGLWGDVRPPRRRCHGGHDRGPARDGRG